MVIYLHKKCITKKSARNPLSIGFRAKKYNCCCYFSFILKYFCIIKSKKCVKLCFPIFHSHRNMSSCLSCCIIKIHCHNLVHFCYCITMNCIMHLILNYSTQPLSPNVISINSLAISLLRILIILSSTLFFARRLIFPYQTTSWSITANLSHDSSTVLI